MSVRSLAQVAKCHSEIFGALATNFALSALSNNLVNCVCERARNSERCAIAKYSGSISFFVNSMALVFLASNHGQKNWPARTTCQALVK